MKSKLKGAGEFRYLEKYYYNYDKILNEFFIDKQ